LCAVFDVFSNPTFSALVGVVVGGLISYVAGVGLARRQRRDTHRAAVRAVVYELTENLPKVMNPGAMGSRVSTSTYDGLLVPLYTDLPDTVSNQVSLAYAMLHVNPVLNFALMPIAQKQLMQTAVTDAQKMLRAYAEKKLKITFVPTP
jgi:hypothetical protein